METKSPCSFSSILLSLELQIKTLLESTGGPHTVDLLDRLGTLSRTEQEIVLGIFSKIINRVASGEVRVSSANDIELKRFEEGLYKDIMDAMIEAANATPKEVKLEVISGGKRVFPKPIVRDIRRNRAKPPTFFKPLFN